jgi:oxygen-independent coproporphyrinogen-3 oxidase
MAGIYIHIPFCKQACHYCDFHFSTQRDSQPDFIKALMREIALRKDYLGKQPIETVYFGGGTPSLLSGKDMDLIFSALHAHFAIAPDAEITLEANPDDLGIVQLKQWKSGLVNRLSIGIQSFRDQDLIWMNRAHTSEQSSDSVKRAQDAGLDNISIDLIYGIPGQDHDAWRENLHQAFELDVQHLSAYGLTVEPRTALASFIKKGVTPAPDEQQFTEQFRILKEEAGWNGFQHYEISNFGKPGYFSKHNTSYWKGVHYLGLGPSAHSFNGHSRSWNVANNPVYIRSVMQDSLPFEVEELSPVQQYNEYVMTSLRTMWGCDTVRIERVFGSERKEHCLTEAEFYLNSGKLVRVGPSLVLTDDGMNMADRIASDLFIV